VSLKLCALTPLLAPARSAAVPRRVAPTPPAGTFDRSIFIARCSPFGLSLPLDPIIVAKRRIENINKSDAAVMTEIAVFFAVKMKNPGRPGP
jgi:hypothetical protein